MKSLLRPAAASLDRGLASLYLSLRSERPGLIAFMFHGLFASHDDAEAGAVDPFQPVTTAYFRDFIQHFKNAGYIFVTPAQIKAGLPADARHALITFDDGYANNLLALPVLRALEVPATIFVSTNHTRDQKAYWWDVLYRERRRSGTDPAAIEREQAALKDKPFQLIEAHLRSEFGGRALEPMGEIDRPLTEAELKRLAAEPLITIGNHTTDHAILPVYDDAEARAQIQGCQDYLAGIVGHAPIVIAYPNGDHDDRIVAIAEAAGLSLGLTVEPNKSPLPLAPRQRMRIPRYALSGRGDVAYECRSCRSDIQLRHSLRRLRAA